MLTPPPYVAQKAIAYPEMRPGQRIRAYDYDPALTHRPVYAEGVITACIASPLEGVEIECDRCTFYGREGSRFVVPYDRDVADFPGRIVLLSHSEHKVNSDD